ncbi:hypothetical protein Q5752_007097 [Cryptotrichosporon argae]
MSTRVNTIQLRDELITFRQNLAYLSGEPATRKAFDAMLDGSSDWPATTGTLPDIAHLQEVNDLKLLRKLVIVSNMWYPKWETAPSFWFSEQEWRQAAETLLTEVRGRLQRSCAIISNNDVSSVVSHLAATLGTLIESAVLHEQYLGPMTEENIATWDREARKKALQALERFCQQAKDHLLSRDETGESARNVYVAGQDAWDAAQKVKAFGSSTKIIKDSPLVFDFLFHGIHGLATNANDSNTFIKCLARASRVLGCNLLDDMRSKKSEVHGPETGGSQFDSGDWTPSR